MIQIKLFLVKCSKIYFYLYIAEQELENQVHDILANTYETSTEGFNVPMHDILKEVEFGLSKLGKQMKENVLFIEVLLQKLFPKAKPKKRKKKGNR